MADNLGVSSGGFDHRVYFIPKRMQCLWDGAALAPAPHRAWIYSPVVSTLAHELGHHLGLYHANAHLGESNGVVEYGDGTAMMGKGSSVRAANVPHRLLLGWIPLSSVLKLRIDCGTHRTAQILAAERCPDSTLGYHAVEIPRRSGRRGRYIVSVRTSAGRWDRQMVSAGVDRVHLHYLLPGMSASSHLVAMISAGQAYTAQDFSLHVLRVGEGSAVVHVSFCTRAASVDVSKIILPSPPLPRSGSVTSSCRVGASPQQGSGSSSTTGIAAEGCPSSTPMGALCGSLQFLTTDNLKNGVTHEYGLLHHLNGRARVFFLLPPSTRAADFTATSTAIVRLGGTTSATSDQSQENRSANALVAEHVYVITCYVWRYTAVHIACFYSHWPAYMLLRMQ